ncbi:MAG: hypothetical protein H6625_12865 [Bdellovibrionaceae bacterium]|nr:hypothetical protein [Pseudobdellovibrionaceae bacterium]
MLHFTKLEKSMMGVTGGVAFILGLTIYFSLFSEALNIKYSDQDKDTFRGPASIIPIQKTESKVKFTDRSMITLDMSCFEEKQVLHFTSAAKMIQIRGKICGSKELKSLEVLNRTNGSKASIFDLKNKQFMTDYLSMAPGKNQVILKLINEEGESFLSELYFESQNILTK